jgi:CRISPR-associated protein Cmr4
LWTEETLPPETLLYIGLDAVSSRAAKTEKLGAGDIFEQIKLLFTDTTGNPWLQLGGNETVGMGWCNVSFLPQTEQAEG